MSILASQAEQKCGEAARRNKEADLQNLNIVTIVVVTVVVLKDLQMRQATCKKRHRETSNIMLRIAGLLGVSNDAFIASSLKQI